MVKYSVPASIVLRLGRGLSPWAMLVLIVLLAWYMAQLLWLMVSPPVVISVSAANNNPVNTPTVDIANTALFTSANTTVAAPSVDLSNLRLLLEGVFVNNGGMSAAIIRSQNIAQRYRVGQVIEGTSLQLTSVGWRQVELTDSNSTAKMLLKFGDTQPSAYPSPNASPPNPSAPDAAMPMGGGGVNPMGGLQGMFKQGVGGVMGSSVFGRSAQLAPQVNNALQKISQSFAENPQQLLSQSGVKASSSGYQVVDTSSPYIKEIGLQVGDTVTSVNGKAVGPDLRQDQALLASLSAARQATIVVTRGSQTLTLNQKW